MTTLTLILLVLLVIAVGAAAYGIYHRRQRAGGVLGVDRSRDATPDGPR